MKKWIGPLISLFVVLILGIGLVFGSFSNLKQALNGKAETGRYSLRSIQDEKEGGDSDPHLLQILKEIQRKLDEWLKKLNDRIEREDVTRFEVRFLEIIRNMLEWLKEKVDAKIESYQKDKKDIEKEQKVTFRETNREVLRFCTTG
jgi:predicted  nucleic acid-binding Zn-ribbon protein